METELIILCVISFGAGFIDSIVGGGGLLQLPALMMILPQYPAVTLLATNKLVSISGTTIAAWRFSRTIEFAKSIIVPAVLSAFAASFLGAYIASVVSSDIFRPVSVVLLIIVFFGTIRNEKFGIVNHELQLDVPAWKPLVIGSILGFYDGFFGPGTGSFLIIAFVSLIGMTFVQGSAYAKLINFTTNLAALTLFMWKAEFLFAYALPMIIFNVAGSLVGVRFALLKGNTFVRGLLRVIIFATIIKLGWDVIK